MKGNVISVTNPSVKSGQTVKGDKTFDWNIMEVEVTKEDGAIVKARGFDTVVDGDTVELTEKPYTGKDGNTYKSWNFAVAKTYAKPDTSGDVLQAVRMVYKLVKDVERKLDTLLANDAALGAETTPIEMEQAAKQAARDYEEVGNRFTKEWADEIPEEPKDLKSFMEEN